MAMKVYVVISHCARAICNTPEFLAQMIPSEQESSGSMSDNCVISAPDNAVMAVMFFCSSVLGKCLLSVFIHVRS